MNPQEICFFRVCYILTGNRGASIRDVIRLFDGVIPYKRMIYYLRKWSGLGFYDYGVCLDLGWINGYRLPDRYKEVLK